MNNYDKPFMMWAGRRVEWTMIHPEFKELWGFLVHGPEACVELDCHPMFPTTPEIENMKNYINNLEESLV